MTAFAACSCPSPLAPAPCSGPASRFAYVYHRPCLMYVTTDSPFDRCLLLGNISTHTCGQVRGSPSGPAGMHIDTCGQVQAALQHMCPSAGCTCSGEGSATNQRGRQPWRELAAAAAAHHACVLCAVRNVHLVVAYGSNSMADGEEQQLPQETAPAEAQQVGSFRGALACSEQCTCSSDAIACSRQTQRAPLWPRRLRPSSLAPMEPIRSQACPRHSGRS